MAPNKRKLPIFPSSNSGEDAEGSSNKRRRVRKNNHQVMPTEDARAVTPPQETASAPEQEEVSAGPSDILKLLSEDLQKEDANLVAEALEKIEDFCEQCVENCETACTVGAHSIIVLVIMKKWQDNEKIQKGCCKCIQCLSCLMYTKTFDEALLQLGTMELTLSAVKKFEGSRDMQNWGFCLLGSLLYFKDATGVKDAVKKFVEEKDGLGLVINAMANFLTDEEIQAEGCRLLRNICRAGDYEKTLVTSGALKAVSAAFTEFPTNAYIKKKAGVLMKKVMGFKNCE